MKFSVLTIHPTVIESIWSDGLLAKAISKNLIECRAIQIRDFSKPPHHRVDDKPYGGGPGMILKIEPLVEALRSVMVKGERTRVILLSAKGSPFRQTTAVRWATRFEHLVFVCGRYEGVDERFAANFADEEVRLGNFVLMGGEVAAGAMIEATARLQPGVLGNPESLLHESFSDSMRREHPQFTRPPDFEGLKVPSVLTKGNHQEIEAWRKQQRDD